MVPAVSPAQAPGVAHKRVSPHVWADEIFMTGFILGILATLALIFIVWAFSEPQE